MVVSGCSIVADSCRYDQIMTARFPDVDGVSLSMVEHRLPGTLAGDVNLLLIAFRQWQQKDVDTWVPTATDLATAHPAFRAYELPVISRVYRPVSGFIDGGMRGGIPDPAVRDTTITLYLDRKRFLAALGIDSVAEIVPMLVTPEGRILWRATGRCTDAGDRSLRDAVAAAL
jgi:hypothetical protein